MPSFSNNPAPWIEYAHCITEVKLTGSCANIGNSAFAECRKLTSISLPDEITEVGSSSFYHCVMLKEMLLPSNVKIIGQSAFGWCLALEKVNLPEGLVSIGECAFLGCGDLCDIEIPSTTMDIDRAAFQQCGSLNKISLPEGIEIVPESIFAYCVNLTSATIPESVTSIGNYAFQDCYRLTDVSIPKGVESIGECAFYECDLKEVTIYYKVSQLDSIAFDKNNSLEKITIFNKDCCLPSDFALSNPDTVICGFTGSTAETYANINGYKFISLDSMHIHNWVKTYIKKQPTCVDSGLEEQICDICGEIKETIIEKLPHNWADDYTVDKKASCTNEGSMSIHCSDCTAIKYTVVIPRTEHEWHNYYTVDVEATCCSEGSKSIHCFNCEDTKDVILIEKTKHKYSDWDIFAEPSCQEAGYEYKQCYDCGDKVYQELPIKSHDWIEEYKEPSCKEEGGKIERCSSCGIGVVVETIKRLEHDWGFYAIVKAPSCNDLGLNLEKCQYCKELRNVETQALGHHYIETSLKEASCIEGGVKTYICKNDSTHTYRVETPATGHNYKVTVTAPTCESEGYTTYTCACGDAYKSGKVEAKGHGFGDWKVTSKPTCTKEGVETRICACGKVEIRTIAKLGHNMIEGPAVAPTCETTGLTAGAFCARCPYEIAQEIVVATGHSYQPVVTDPTCEAEGYTTYTCKCGHTYIADKTTARDHEYGVWKVTTAATCTTEGVETRTCECGKTETRVMAATDHRYGGWTVIRSAEIGKLGLERKLCLNGCGNYSDERDITIISAGTCGPTSSWSLDVSGVMTISGSGSVSNERSEAFMAAISKATKLVFEEGITEIEASFENAYNLTSVAFADSIEVIGKMVFCKLWKLDCAIDLPENLKYIGSDAFGDTRVKVDFMTAPNLENIGAGAFNYCSSMSGDIELPSSVVSIGGSAFYNTSIDHVIINNPNCEIGAQAFHESTYLVGVAGSTAEKYGGLFKYLCEYYDTNHNYHVVVTEPTCTEEGYTTYTCECGDIYTADQVGAKGHTPKDVVKQAKVGVKGQIASTCTVCGELLATTTIAAVAKPAVVAKAFTGKTLTQTVKIKDAKGKVITTVKLTGKNVGTFKKTVKLKGNYSGSVTVSFKINPKGTTLGKLTSAKKALTVKWNKPKATFLKQTTGYEIRYSTKSGMGGAKTKVVKKAGTTSLKLTGLKAKTKYYVQIRTYKTVNGTKYYSAWSVKKSMKTK